MIITGAFGVGCGCVLCSISCSFKLNSVDTYIHLPSINVVFFLVYKVASMNGLHLARLRGSLFNDILNLNKRQRHAYFDIAPTGG